MHDQRTQHRRQQHAAQQPAVQVTDDFLQHERCGRQRVLKAAASRRFCLASPARAGQVRAHRAGQLHAGSFAPETLAATMLTIPATNFTQATRHGTVPKSFQKASLSCGMPLPAASRQKSSTTSHQQDETTIIARLPMRKVDVDCWDSLPSPSR